LKKTIHITKKFTFSGHNTAVYALCNGPDETSFISGSGDKYIAQWNLFNGTQEKFSAKLPSPVFSLLPMYNFNQVWVGTGNGHIHVLDLKKREEIHAFKFHSIQVFDMKYSEKLGLVFSCGGDGTVSCYDAQQLKHLHSQKFSDVKIRSIEFYGDSLLLAEGSGKTIVVNPHDLSVEHEFVSHKLATNCYFADESNGLLYSGGRDAHLNLWDIKNNYFLLKSLPAHNYAIYRIVDVPRYGIIATASRDKTIKLWEKDTLQIVQRIGKESHEGHSFSVNAMIWNEGMRTLVSAGDDRTIISWEIRD
jgi:WD repeat-containing protein 61